VTRRIGAYVGAIVVLAIATLFGTPASAAPDPFAMPPGDLCTTAEWRNPGNFQRCVDALQDVSAERAACLNAPIPSTPDSGMPGFFASRPEASRQNGRIGIYSRYGYGGYAYTTYDINCASTFLHPDYKFETTVANGEFMIATSIIGASNALRERAWNPQAMWGWADPLVDRATRAVYDKVFTVFGAITLAVVGLYLLWRSRQSDLSNATTTAGWALLVMVAITAIASWPTFAANIADKTLLTSLGVIHDAVGPPAEEPDVCPNPIPSACVDNRPPAVRASDTATEGMLYKHWLRGLLGTADSETALKYGPALYDARTLSWIDVEKVRQNPSLRQEVIDQKARNWMKIAEQIKREDPEAYEYLQGTKGTERMGAGFIAILSSVFFALFDMTAAILVLLGFLIFRWAVVAAPILGTIGLLRPASSGLRRLGNAVVAAIFNIIIFGTGSAIYLFAVSLIMSTGSLPGWLQVMLIWLTGIVGWLLLRPYRRITQLGGKDSTDTVTSVGGWHRLFMRDVRQTAALKVVEGSTEAVTKRGAIPETRRPESRHEDVVAGTSIPATTASSAQRVNRREPQWEEPDVQDDSNPAYAVYRPSSTGSQQPAAPVRRPESAPAPR
jgi:hypothetical protein